MTTKPARKRKPNNQTWKCIPSDYVEMVKLYKAGFTMGEIAEEYRVTRQAVSKKFMAMGVEARPVGKHQRRYRSAGKFKI